MNRLTYKSTNEVQIVITPQTKVLLVDDFAMIRTMMRSALSDLGFSTIDETDGAATALKLLQEAHVKGNPYGVMFLDWNMQGMSGIDLLQICRDSIEFKNLPIIMVTAEAEKKNVLKALSLGATDYIVKPCSSEVLENKLKQVNKYLEQKQNLAAS